MEHAGTGRFFTLNLLWPQCQSSVCRPWKSTYAVQLYGHQVTHYVQALEHGSPASCALHLPASVGCRMLSGRQMLEDSRKRHRLLFASVHAGLKSFLWEAPCVGLSTFNPMHEEVLQTCLSVSSANFTRHSSTIGALRCGACCSTPAWHRSNGPAALQGQGSA